MTLPIDLLLSTVTYISDLLQRSLEVCSVLTVVHTIHHELLDQRPPAAVSVEMSDFMHLSSSVQ